MFDFFFFFGYNVICLKKVKKYNLKVFWHYYRKVRARDMVTSCICIPRDPTGCASRNSRGFKTFSHKIPSKMSKRKDEMQTNEEDLGEGEQGELPVALQCSQCNVILGDSMSWASTNDDLKSITLHSKFICICMFVSLILIIAWFRVRYSNQVRESFWILPVEVCKNP